jgi:hypothetical protein
LARLFPLRRFRRLGDLHVGAGLMQLEPAFQREIKAGFVFRRRALELI